MQVTVGGFVIRISKEGRLYKLTVNGQPKGETRSKQKAVDALNSLVATITQFHVGTPVPDRISRDVASVLVEALKYHSQVEFSELPELEPEARALITNTLTRSAKDKAVYCATTYAARKMKTGRNDGMAFFAHLDMPDKWIKPQGFEGFIQRLDRYAQKAITNGLKDGQLGQRWS